MSSRASKFLGGLKNSSRANFVIAAIVGLSVAIIGYTAITGQAATVRTSLKSGNWSDASVWGGTIPQAGDPVIIAAGHTVTHDVTTSTVGGVTVNEGGTLNFDSNKTTTLQSDQNVIIRGKLVMKPSSASIIQTLRFINIDETKFVGGGMEPIATDVGLWVMGNGQLDLKGAEKKAWTRTTGSANQGTTSLSLQDAPSGWQLGDDLVISPTELGDFTTFDPRTVTAINGNTVGLSSGLSKSHPAVSFNNKTMTPEVMNLTRNVRIEGTQPQFEQPRAGKNNTNGGRAHIFIRSTKHQTIDYVQIRHMGPRKSITNCWIGNDCSDSHLGRYGLHFHQAFNSSRGSQITGTVVRDIGGPGFVPHGSNGVVFKDTIAYATHDTAYWWDPPYAPDENGRLCVDPNCKDGISDDTIWDRAVAAYTKIDPYATDSTTGFALQKSLGSVVRDSVAVGNQGSVSAGGFGWLEGSNHSPWQMLDNVAHNNSSFGIFWWQVDDVLHPVERFISYRNGYGMTKHGAYLNNAHYTDFASYQDGFREDAGNGQGEFSALQLIAAEAYMKTYPEDEEMGQKWADGYVDGGGQTRYGVSFNTKIAGGSQIELSRLWVKGYTVKPVIIYEPNDGGPVGGDTDGFTTADFICWDIGDTKRDLQPSDIELKDGPYDVKWDTRINIRVQRKDGTAFRISGNKQITNIAKFADCGTKPTDTERPTAPTNVKAKITTQNGETYYDFSWSPSSDNVGVEGYRVTRRAWDRVISYTTSGTSIQDNGAEIFGDDQNLSLVVTAYDAAGNISDPSLTSTIDRDDGTVYNPPTSPPSDSDPDPPPADKLGDINNDGLVNILDLSILLSNWNKSTSQLSNPKADVNGDGSVNIIDLSTLLSKWGS